MKIRDSQQKEKKIDHTKNCEKEKKWKIKPSIGWLVQQFVDLLQCQRLFHLSKIQKRKRFKKRKKETPQNQSI